MKYNFGKKLEAICSFSDRFYSRITLEGFADLTIKVPVLAKVPNSLCNSEFLIAAAKQQKIHRERKEREKKR